MQPAKTRLFILSLFTMSLVACGGSSESDGEEENKAPVNSSPIANAGVQQTVKENTSVTLSGSGTDSDGSIVSYSWVQTTGTKVTLSDSDKATASFTAPDVITDETIAFGLTVTDNDGASVTDSVNVTIQNVNQLPMANAGADLTVEENTSVTLSGSGTDSDGSIVSYSWVQTTGTKVTLSDSDKATASFTAPDVITDETIAFGLTVTDNDGASVTDSVNVTIQNVNQLPMANAGPDLTVEENTSVTLSGSGTDSDGTIVSYQWIQAGGTSVTINNINTQTASFTAPGVSADETLTFQLTVKDNEGLAAVDNISITVTPEQVKAVSGQISFDKFNIIPTDGYSIDSEGYNFTLDFDNPESIPARQILVNLINLENEILMTTITDESGLYKFELDENMSGESYYLEVVGTLEFDNDFNNEVNLSIYDSLNSGNIYSVKKEILIDHIETNSIHDIHLSTGWNAQSRTFEYDLAISQPFAILDHLLKTTDFYKNKLGESFSTTVMPKIVWTKDHNRPIFPSSYQAHINTIFIDGGFEGDFTQAGEWSPVTIAHEFSHFYLKKVIGRDDSPGMYHATFSTSEPSLAFSEAFAQAVAFAVESDWTSYGVPTVGYKAWVENFHYIANNGYFDGCLTTSSSEIIGVRTAPCARYSNFTEGTLTYFLLSLLDNKKDTTLRTTNFYSEHGFSADTLVKALKDSAQKESQFTIMSVYESLIQQAPQMEEPLNRLADKLNLKFSDQWGTGITHLDGVIITEGQEFPTEAYLPLTLNLSNSLTPSMCFNDSIFDASTNNPGIVRYAKYSADTSGDLKISLDGITDSDGLKHDVDIEVFYKGGSIGRYVFEGDRRQAEFTAVAGRTYSIRFTDLYFRLHGKAINETICSTIRATPL